MGEDFRWRPDHPWPKAVTSALIGAEPAKGAALLVTHHCLLLVVFVSLLPSSETPGTRPGNGAVHSGDAVMNEFTRPIGRSAMLVFMTLALFLSIGERAAHGQSSGMIENWSGDAKVWINGQPAKSAGSVHIGSSYSIEHEDLVLWMQLSSQERTEIRIEPDLSDRSGQ